MAASAAVAHTAWLTASFWFSTAFQPDLAEAQPRGRASQRSASACASPRARARPPELAALAETGKLTLRVADTLPLTEVRAAHERLAQGGLRGRLVLQP